MTQNLNNEYSRLLSYLENNQPEIKVVTSKNLVKKQKTKESEEKSQTIKTPDRIEKVAEEIKDVPVVSSTKGFDVQKFESLMRSKLIDDYKRMQSYERPYISVSELYYCIRRNYYNRQKYPINVKEEFSFSYLYLIQKVGHVVHDIVQDLYDFTEVEKTVVSQKYKVKGRVDALKNEFLYEVKSIDPDKFENKYIREHYYQGIIYSYILNSEYNYKVKTITIVYFIRTLKKIYPFDLPVNDELAKSFLKRSLVLQSSLQSKKVPEPIGATPDQCKYCPYKKFCGKDPCEVVPPFKDQNTEKKPVFLL